METDVDVEILKTRIPTSTCKTPAGVSHRSHRPGDYNNRGGPNQMIKVGQIKWTKPCVCPQAQVAP